MPDAPLPPLPPADQPQWLAYVADLRRRLPFRAAVAVTAVVAVALVAAGVLILRPARTVSMAALPTAVPAPGEPAEPPERPVGRAGGEEEVVVDVAGAVARPGLVRLRSGDRVADAISAAGGVAADAETAGVNQARVVTDGEQVRVPRVGEPPRPDPARGEATAPEAGGPAARVDLNRATLAELDTLPGVGPATATAIIAWRDENGGFRRVDDLLEVPGIGPARLERLRALVRV